MSDDYVAQDLGIVMAEREYGVEPLLDDHEDDHEDNGEIDRRYLDLLGRLLDLEGLRKIPPPEPLIEGWLDQKSLAWIQGKWGNAKSFVAVDIGCCVATGTSWHGFTVTQGRVLYLIAEGASGISQRVDAWEAANGREATGIVFLPIPVRLSKPDEVDVIAVGMLLDTIKPVLVIIDTQARVTVGAEENSSKDMGLFVDALEMLRRKSGSTMLPVHHEPRNGENLRGSVALEGAADSIIRTEKDGDNVTISNPKQKNAPEHDSITLTLYGIGESAALFSEVPGAEQSLSPNDQKIIDTLADFPNGSAPLSTWMTACDVPKGSFYRSRNRLVQKGKVIERQQGTSTICRIPNQDRAQQQETEPPPEPDDDAPARSPEHMRRVAEAITKHGSIKSKAQLEKAVAGKAKEIRDALDYLILDGYVTARPYSMLKPYPPKDDKLKSAGS